MKYEIRINEIEKIVQLSDFRDWATENNIFDWRYYHNKNEEVYYFNNVNDAVLFKLTWL